MDNQDYELEFFNNVAEWQDWQQFQDQQPLDRWYQDNVDLVDEMHQAV